MYRLRGFPTALRQYRSWTTKLSYHGGLAGAMCIVVLTLLVTVTVLGRYSGAFSVLFTHEVAGYLLISLAFIGMAYTDEKEGHIHVDLLTCRLTLRARRSLQVIASFLLLGFLVLLLWQCLDLVLTSYQTKILAPTVSRTPLYIPQILLTIGLLLFALAAINRITKNLSPLTKQKEEK